MKQKMRILLLLMAMLMVLLPKAAISAYAAESGFSPETYLSVDEASLQLRKWMVDRETNCSLEVYSENRNIDEVLQRILDKAMEHTGVPNEGDYLRWHLYGVRTESSLDSQDERYCYYSLSLQLYYYSTAEQEAAVSSEIDAVLNSLNLDSKTDYEKVKAVYDYICRNTAYDHSLSLESHSAHSALIKKKAVCQGYSNLTYRMLLELGIDNRFIGGYLKNKGSHAWNIVRLGEWYYNVDTTVDAGREKYLCFLKADTSLPDHTRDEEYRTAEFYAQYPMAPADYDPLTRLPHVHNHKAEVKEPTCLEGGFTTFTCTCGDTYIGNHVDALKHAYSEEVTPPVCGYDGYTTYRCNLCGHSYVGDRTPALEHVYEVVVTEATCWDGGFTTYTCKLCGHRYLDDYTDKRDHDYDTKVTLPDCYHGGSTVYTCKHCGYSYVGDEVGKIEHIYEDEVTLPTCWNEGYTTHTCKNCGYHYRDTYTEPRKHEFKVEVVPAQCTQGGYTLHTCVLCDYKEWTDPTDWLWHTYENGICIRCGEPEEGTPHTHYFGEWTETKAAACETPGEKQRTCSCGEVETESIPALEHAYEEGICTVCGEKDPDYVKPMEPTEPEPTEPEAPSAERISGGNRITTALTTSEKLKGIMGIERFSTIVVADAMSFPDALSGSYLAAVTKAPILLYTDGQNSVVDYIKENLAEDGTVYILGGKASVPDSLIAKLDGIICKRIAGSGRLATSLEIIAVADELRGTKPEKILICDGRGFADSLSASATGLPILLVNGEGSLNIEQKAYLESVRGAELYVIGGKSSVSEDILNSLSAYDADGAERVFGSGRELTSVEVAKKFFPHARAAVLASSVAFPDGLSGGPVAHALGAPLLLTRTSKEAIASGYVSANGITSGYIVGGESAVSNTTADAIFPKDTRGF